MWQIEIHFSLMHLIKINSCVSSDLAEIDAGAEFYCCALLTAEQGFSFGPNLSNLVLQSFNEGAPCQVIDHRFSCSLQL